MGDRRLRVAPHFPKLTIPTMQLWSLPTWILASFTVNCFLLLLLLVNLREQSGTIPPANSALATQPQTTQANLTTLAPAPIATSSLSSEPMGQRHQLSYEQWLDLLKQEAKAISEQNSPHLTVLAGDSISLWFPYDLLPTEKTWLNQGISGETSAGLLNRLTLFDGTSPEAIFVMIGINDLIHGVPNTEILENQQEIIRYLKTSHPRSHIVMQSILPHAGEKATWEGRDRLKAISNHRIRNLNADLADLAAAEAVYYLDLYSLFADAEGNLQTNLSTDGLHLNAQGYLVWRTALQLYSKMQWETED